MAKITLNDVSNITGNPTSAQNTINTNSTAIETAIEKTLSRDGTSPNEMNADLDMNSNDILNVNRIQVATVDAESITIDDIPIEHGGRWYVDDTTPSSSVGEVGDMYLDSSTGNVYGPKGTGGWGSPSADITGPTGATGAAGSSTGDMTKEVYDPQSRETDAFYMPNFTGFITYPDIDPEMACINYTTDDTYTFIDSRDANKFHIARSSVDNVTWNVAGVGYQTMYWFGADVNSTNVKINTGPQAYFRNVDPLNVADNDNQTIQLYPGTVVGVYRITTNEFWIVTAYTNVYYKTLGTGGNWGYFATGPNGTYHGAFRTTLTASTATTVDLNTMFTGMPTLTGTKTIVTSIVPIAGTPSAGAYWWADDSNGAGTVSIESTNTNNVVALISFINAT